MTKFLLQVLVVAGVLFAGYIWGAMSHLGYVAADGSYVSGNEVPLVISMPPPIEGRRKDVSKYIAIDTISNEELTDYKSGYSRTIGKVSLETGDLYPYIIINGTKLNYSRWRGQYYLNSDSGTWVYILRTDSGYKLGRTRGNSKNIEFLEEGQPLGRVNAI